MVFVDFHLNLARAADYFGGDRDKPPDKRPMFLFFEFYDAFSHHHRDIIRKHAQLPEDVIGGKIVGQGRACHDLSFYLLDPEFHSSNVVCKVRVICSRLTRNC